MAINVSQSFHRTSANAVDDTLTLTKAEMKTVNDNLMPSKYLTVCQDDGLIYLYDKSNTVDSTTGKFRVFESGGGGHEIEDDSGTALTQRETMQFGDGFNVSDDSTNEKTIVEPNLMTSADMDDVVTPLPGTFARYHEYSTTEQVVGKWIDGSTIYEKTFIDVANPQCDTLGTDAEKLIDIGASVGRIINVSNVSRKEGQAIGFAPSWMYVNFSATLTSRYVVFAYENSDASYANKIRILNNTPSYNAIALNITIQYTKTT